MALDQVALTDKYLLDTGRIYLSGTQALVRLALAQKRRDAAAGLNTAGFISGYPGSPLHSLDLELSRIPELLAEHRVKFTPGLNEDLAATAVRGSQMAGLYGDGTHDGVFALWYGKNPGLDRSIDAIRHANLAGSSRHGGVLAIIGDDHGMKSTDTLAHCEATCEDLLMPLLYPANVQDVLDLGQLGIALSRFSGAWVGFKMLSETVECSGAVDIAPGRIEVKWPEFGFPPGGVHARANDIWLASGWDRRLTRYKIPAAVAFARANRLNRVTHNSATPRLGIVAAGKAWLDVLEALQVLGIAETELDGLGITIYKVGMVFPHDIEGYRDFARGLDEVLVVEEKRRQIEGALREACYALPESQRPRIVGRHDERGQMLISELRELTPENVAAAIAGRLHGLGAGEEFAARLEQTARQQQALDALPGVSLARLPFFCSGCPHNTSTLAPEGSRAHAGIGCHGMGWLVGRANDMMHMGGEGAHWIGEAPHVKTPHIFQNLGDGTYAHSGSLAIRAAIAAEVNITFKILYNDAVAMTGGQPIEGQISPASISRQVAAEGVGRIEVVTDEPDKYGAAAGFAPGVRIHHRRQLESLQRDLAGHPGVSVLIYDQTCAAEKRRRRKRGLYPDPSRRAFINDRVCEGCGDCGVKSNCLSVVPQDTGYGRKRKIDQSSCNKDYSCLEGFCPSFVTVLGGALRKGAGIELQTAGELAEPVVATIPAHTSYRILIAGIGGTGVVTIGALLGMAARLEGKAISVVDQLGLSQKAGAVVSHIQIASRDADLRAVRVRRASADLLLGCDSLTAAGEPALATVRPGRTHAVVNTHQSVTGAFMQDPDAAFPADAIAERIRATVGERHCDFIEATELATRLLGDAIAANVFLLGFAWQKGLLPLGSDALMRAIEMNGAAVDWNKQAFAWGRRAAIDPEQVARLADPSGGRAPELLDELIGRLAGDLAEYQDSAYAARFRALVARVRVVERSLGDASGALAASVARNAYKLMAYKDEYEVARLHADPAFRRKLDEQFEGNYRLRFHLAPPGLTRKDPVTGVPRKIELGGWMLGVFGLLRHLKFLRGTPFDPFGRTRERRAERALVAEYEQTVDELLPGLDADRHALAVEIAGLPEMIRGYGHIKDASLTRIRARRAELLARWRAPAAPRAVVVNALEA